MPQSPPHPGIDAETEFQARDYFRASWRLVRQDPFLLLWRLLADGLGWVARPLLLMWVLTITGVWVDSFSTTGRSSMAIFATAFNRIVSLPYLGSVAGLIACVSIFTFLIDALVTGGIWGTLARGVRDEEIDRFATFGADIAPNFPKVVMLRFFSAVAQWTVGLTGLCVVIALVGGFMAPGGFMALGTWSKALVIAVPAFVFFVFGALVRLTFQAAAAPLFVDDRPLGTSIAFGAQLVIRHLAGVYRIFVFAAGLLLVPLFLYWGVLMLRNGVGADSPFMVVVWPLRLTVEIFLFTSISAISVVYYGAMFGYWSRLSGHIDLLPGMEREDDASERAFETAGPGAGPGGYRRETTLEQLLPEHHETADYADIPGLELDAPEDAHDPEDEQPPEQSAD